MEIVISKVFSNDVVSKIMLFHGPIIIRKNTNQTIKNVKLIFVSTKHHSWNYVKSYFKFNDDIIKTDRFKSFQEHKVDNPIWLSDDGTYMIGAKKLEKTLTKGSCYNCDIKLTFREDCATHDIGCSAIILNITEHANDDDDDDDPFS